MADALTTAAVAFATVVAAGLAALSAAAWRRDRRPRFALLTAAFALALVEGAYLSWGLWSGAAPLRMLAISALVDALFLGMVYLAVIKR